MNFAYYRNAFAQYNITISEATYNDDNGHRFPHWVLEFPSGHTAAVRTAEDFDRELDDAADAAGSAAGRWL